MLYIRYTFIITCLFISHVCKSQCKYKWLVLNDDSLKTGDTVLTNTSLHPRLEGKVDSVDFRALIEKIKFPLYSQEQIDYQQQIIDSLNKINTDKARREGELIQYYQESIFQLLNQDGIQYALYSIDTFKLDSITIPIYKIATSFYKEWNEGFCNYMFFYTKDYGVVVAYYSCPHTLSFEQYRLISTHHFTLQDIQMKEKIANRCVLKF